MPIAKIHVAEGRYDEARLEKVSQAIEAALINTLGIPPEETTSRRAYLAAEKTNTPIDTVIAAGSTQAMAPVHDVR